VYAAHAAKKAQKIWLEKPSRFGAGFLTKTTDLAEHPAEQTARNPEFHRHHWVRGGAAVRLWDSENQSII